MLYLQFNMIETHKKFLYNIEKFKEKINKFFFIHVIDTFEIELLFSLNQNELEKLIEYLNEKNANIVLKNKNIIKDLKNNSKLFLYINIENENEFVEIIHSDKQYYIYGNLIKNFEILKNILKFIENNKIYDKLFIKTEENEEENIIPDKEKKRNIFKIKEINYYLDEIYDINYIGFTFYLIKYYNEYIINYLKLIKEDKLKNDYLKLKNIIKKQQNIRNNKKLHVLNINNIQEIEEFRIYKSKINPNKYFLINKNGEYFNIKNVLVLNRKNIFKIKNKYNRSNEYIYIYTHRDYYNPEINNKKFLIKITKSISKDIKKKIEPYPLDRFLKDILKKEKEEQEKLRSLNSII